MTDQGEQGLAIFRVRASNKVIWSVLHDFEKYDDWVSDLSKTEIYKTEGNNIYVSFESSHWLLGSNKWFVKHTYPSLSLSESELKINNWGIWTLDYQRRSDFKDSVGYWQVLPVAGKVDQHDVIYSINLALYNVPEFIKKRVVKNGLKKATQWVKTQAESRQSQIKNQ